MSVHFGNVSVGLLVAALAMTLGGCQKKAGAQPSSQPATGQPEPAPPDATYAAARDLIETKRSALAERLAVAHSEADRKRILSEAHAVFAEGICRHLAPWWKGTPWDFNGVTQTPRQGKIACGYYVSTLLLHAGLQVERIRMAQQASLHIIHTLVGSDPLVKGHGLPLPQFVERIKARGQGLYIVGLDNHTGFLWHDGARVWFLHSSFVGPRCVMKEPALDSSILAASNYRVAGYLSGNDALMETWLTAKSLPTKLPSA